MYQTSDEFIKDYPEITYSMALKIAASHDCKEDFEEEFTGLTLIDSDCFFTWLGY